MVRTVKEHERLIVKVMCEIEAGQVKNKKGKTLYDAVCHSAEAFGEDPDNLPEHMLDGMYKATTEIAEEGLKKLVGDGIRMIDRAINAVKAMPEEPTSEQVKQIQKKVEEATLPFMFLASVVKTVTDDFDYEYLAEQMLESGRAAKKKAEQPATA